jgi:plasmid stability protein
MVKATFELPEELIERLRARSEREARPVDAVAAEILQTGLSGEANPSMDELFGGLSYRAPTKPFDSEEFRRLQEAMDIDWSQWWGIVEQELQMQREDRH